MGKNIAIIGGGPAGLSSAYELANNNVKCSVYERSGLLGGIAKTIKYKGYYFDLGGHRFFTKNREIGKIWHDTLKEDFLQRPRLSRIYYKKKFYSYPIKIFEVIRNLGPFQSILILFSYFRSRLFPYKNEDNFEQWVSNRFGNRLFNTFFKSYTEKVWGIPCSEIQAEWAAQRIRGLSFISALMTAILGNRGRKIKTLINEFEYPKYGPGMMWEGMARHVTARGGAVNLNTDVVSINLSGRLVKSISIKSSARNEEIATDDLISSMPLKELINSMAPKPPDSVVNAANKLKYRSFITVALIIDEENMFPDNWIYIHSPEVRLGRVQNFKNWSPFLVPDPAKTCLGLEYFCFENDDLWNTADETLIRLGSEELKRIGLLKDISKVIDGKIVRVAKAYPVYDAEYKYNLSVIRDFLNSIDNLQVIGRNGMHRYNNMDHSMLTGVMAARKIMGESTDIWSVNADDEYHEEQQ